MGIEEDNPDSKYFMGGHKKL